MREGVRGDGDYDLPGVVEKIVGGEVGDRCGGEVGDFMAFGLIRLSILNALHFSDCVFDGVIRC